MIDPAALLNVGAIGVVLAWFMWRFEGRMAGVERELHRVSLALLLDIASRPGAALSVTREAETLLSDMRRDHQPRHRE